VSNVPIFIATHFGVASSQGRNVRVCIKPDTSGSAFCGVETRIDTATGLISGTVHSTLNTVLYGVCT